MAKKSNNEKFQRPRGTYDILPADWPAWNQLMEAVSSVAVCYNFGRIETPIIESTELFERGVGEETDIVQKEMYSFKTRGRQALTLRPEGTASIVRAYIENGMRSWPQPVKLWYMGPMFRHERPQKGRYRQFFQFGAEVLGDGDAVLDAEIIQWTVAVLRELKLNNLLVLVNSVGCSLCRSPYIDDLRDAYTAQKRRLCKNCRERIDHNPLRVLDCKEEKCRQLAQRAPQLIDHLCEGCHAALTEVLEYLDALKIPYLLEPHLVRGFDYYTKTVFEVVIHDRSDDEDNEEGESESKEENGANEERDEDDADRSDHDEGQTVSLASKRTALAGGGRYDDLVAELGGPSVPAVGVAAGVERIFSAMDRQGLLPESPLPPRVFLVQLGQEARRRSLLFLEELRSKGIAASYSFSKGSIKSQLKIANNIGVDAAFIIGRKEAMAEEVILRDMENGVQETVPMGRAVTELGKILRRKPRALKLRENRAAGVDNDAPNEDEEEEE